MNLTVLGCFLILLGLFFVTVCFTSKGREMELHYRVRGIVTGLGCIIFGVYFISRGY